ncbi:MAG TPA: hypothetical protein VK639_16785 [Terriglobales bacterium]|nr:hypothetical protein [Terriglobales bacterium]
MRRESGCRGGRGRPSSLRDSPPDEAAYDTPRHAAATPRPKRGLVGQSSYRLRQFFHYCAKHRYTQMDFGGLVPTVRGYRHASLPKGTEDSALERRCSKQ